MRNFESLIYAKYARLFSLPRPLKSKPPFAHSLLVAVAAYIYQTAVKALPKFLMSEYNE